MTKWPKSHLFALFLQLTEGSIGTHMLISLSKDDTNYVLISKTNNGFVHITHPTGLTNSLRTTATNNQTLAINLVQMMYKMMNIEYIGFRFVKDFRMSIVGNAELITQIRMKTQDKKYKVDWRDLTIKQIDRHTYFEHLADGRKVKHECPGTFTKVLGKEVRSRKRSEELNRILSNLSSKSRSCSNDKSYNMKCWFCGSRKTQCVLDSLDVYFEYV